MDRGCCAVSLLAIFSDAHSCSNFAIECPAAGLTKGFRIPVLYGIQTYTQVLMSKKHRKSVISLSSQFSAIQPTLTNLAVRVRAPYKIFGDDQLALTLAKFLGRITSNACIIARRTSLKTLPVRLPSTKAHLQFRVDGKLLFRSERIYDVSSQQETGSDYSYWR